MLAMSLSPKDFADVIRPDVGRGNYPPHAGSTTALGKHKLQQGLSRRVYHPHQLSSQRFFSNLYPYSIP
jgi:hypothetical protein